MACGSCGQKYRGLRNQRRSPGPIPVARRVRNVRGPVIKAPTYPAKTTDISADQSAVTVQEDTKQAVEGTPPSYPIDPTTGLALDVIKTGSCPENDLGDTAPQPVDLSAEDVATIANKNNVGG